MNRIDVLPDDILLEIFDFCVGCTNHWEGKRIVEKWQSLVHVCRRWRSLVLASPRRLNLRLFCTPRTPAKDTLDAWPALPLIVSTGRITEAFTQDTDQIIAALGQSNRVCQVDLYLAGWQMEQVLAAMQVPFPELTDLWLTSQGETMSVIPDSFLDRSAPRLRELIMGSIPFPGLPNLLLSANHLVALGLINIPHSGYFSPEAIVALLSVLSSLERFSIGFQSPQSRPDGETRPPPSKRSVIPALTYLHFKGVIEYAEDLVTCIDTPQLDNLHITLFNQIDFDIPQLAQFINRTPKLWKPDAHVQFDDYSACFRLQTTPGSRTIEIAIRCKESDWQLSSIEQVCNSSLHHLSMAEDLYVENPYDLQLEWKDGAIENTLWLQLLRSFNAVKNLYLSEVFAPGIATALQELVGGRIMEVLPSLQNIFVERLRPSGLFQKNIGLFAAARQLSDHPIAISVWNTGRYIDTDTDAQVA